MESSFKKNINECQQDSNKVDVETEQSASREETPSTPELTQLELISQWRLNLQQSLKDLGFSISESNLANDINGFTPDINEKLEYLTKTDNLLLDHDDFALSDAGFEKYQSANLSVVSYLAQLHQEKKYKAEDDKNVKFYFFSRSKHINQQANSIPLLFVFCHLLLLIISTASLIIGGVIVANLSQMNGIVLLLLVAVLLTIFGIVKGKIRTYKEKAETPIRFIISLLSICSILTVVYAMLFIATPALLAWEFKPFWRDDVMIIGLGLFTFFMLGHSAEAPEEATEISSVEAIK